MNARARDRATVTSPGSLHYLGVKNRLPGKRDLGFLRSTLHLKRSGKLVDDLVDFSLAIVHIDHALALGLIYEWPMRPRLEKESGKQQALRRKGSDGPLRLDDCNEVEVRIIKAEEVIDMRFNAFRHRALQHAIKALFHLVLIFENRPLAPEDRLLASHQVAKLPGHASMLIEIHGAGTLDFVRGVRQQRRIGRSRIASGLTDSAGSCVPPAKQLKWTHLLARIKEDLFSACTQNDDVVIKLIEIQIAGRKNSPFAVHHLHVPGCESRSSQHCEIQKRDVLAGSALLGQGIFRALRHAQSHGLQLYRALLARVIGVIESLYGLVEFIGLVELVVAGSGKLRHRFWMGLVGSAKWSTSLAQRFASLCQKSPELNALL